MPNDEALSHAATALVSALAALKQAETAVEVALARLQGQMPPREIRPSVAVRTTSLQVMSVLSTAADPLSLQDVADGVVAIRRGEDEPRKSGFGTRYQEMCRHALTRLIAQGLVERVEPTAKNGRMRFRRVSGNH